MTENLQKQVKKEKATQEKLEKYFNLIMGVLNYDNFKDVDLVIEVGFTIKLYFHQRVCLSLISIYNSKIIIISFSAWAGRKS